MKTNNHSIIYRNDFYGLILLFFNDNCIDYALIQKSKILDFKFPAPDKNNQITQNDNKLFDISNKFFKICELLDEYEVIPIDQITTVITCETVRVGSGFYVHKMHVTIYVAISNTPLPTRTVSQVITVLRIE